MNTFAKLLTLTVILLCLLPVTALHAQENYNITETSEIFTFWSFVDDIAIYGNYAFIVSSEDGLFIYDISTPAEPVLTITFRSLIGDRIKVDNQYAYIYSNRSDDSNTFTIVDISDVSAPVEQGSFQLHGKIRDVEIGNDNLYIFHNYDTMSIVNLSDPDNPSISGEYTNAERISSMTLNGDYLAMALAQPTEDDLIVLDISDPDNINLLNSYIISDESNNSDIVTDGQNLYMVMGLTLYSWEFSGNGTLTSESQTTLEEHVGGELFIEGSSLFCCRYNSIVAFDITDPSAPTFAGEYEVPGSQSVIYPKGLVSRSIDNSVLGGIFTDVTSGLGEYVTFLDIRNPSDIIEITNYNKQEWIFDVQVEDNLLFSKGKKLRTIDIQDISSPEVTSVINREFDEIAHNENYLFGLFESDSLFVYDFSNTGSPELINQFELSYSSLSALVSISATDNYLSICYPSADSSKVEIYDITNPSNITQPALRETFPSQSGGDYFIHKAVVYGNHLYVLGDFGNFDLRIYEIFGSDPVWSMTLQREMSLSETCGDMYFENAKIQNENLILFSWREYAIYDLDDMNNPEFIYGETLQHGSIRDIAYLGNHIFRTGNFDLSITDITNPENPWVSGYYHPTYLVDHFFLDEDHIFLSTISRINIYNYANAMGIDETTPTSAPTNYELVKAYPNPFNPTLNIRVSLPETGALKLTVHNVLGQEVAVLSDRTLERGYHNFTFNGNDLSSGVYFVKAVVEGKMNDVQKVMLMK